MANKVTISGMFGAGKTYFANAPVMIDISGLVWSQPGKPVTSPFTIVRMEVVYKKVITGGYELVKVGEFKIDTGKQTSISFDISSALKAIWSDYVFTTEVAAAQNAVTAGAGQAVTRDMREYVLRVFTEYMAGDDGGVFTETQYEDAQGNKDIPGGQCLLGGMTEWERSLIDDKANADVSHLEHTGVRNGDASTKPTSSPERVGSTSITSWVDVQTGLTKSIFYPASTTPEADDIAGQQQGWTGHAPIVLRDSQPYIDFLFINRRGAIETCSGLTKESMGINSETKQYGRTDGPTFKPTRSLMAIGTDGRRSWQMSSGPVTREWAEWWVQEFLNGKRKQWWMLWQGPGLSEPRYVPVTVKPAKSDITIYDKTKQQMAHVDFTVTLALEG